MNDSNKQPDQDPVDRVTLRQQVVVELLGEVRWETPERGSVKCPGAHLHTTGPNNDATIFIDGAPTIHCFHQSCADVVAEENKRLRAEIHRCEKEAGTTLKISAAALLARKKAFFEEQRKIAQWDLELRRAISNPGHPQDLAAASPNLLPGRIHEGRFEILRLFHPNDVIWTGAQTDSTRWNFTTATERIEQHRCVGPLICPSSFHPGAGRRNGGSIASRRFLVVESDDLSLRQQTALIFHLRQTWPLAAVVYSGGRSLHAWFRWLPIWDTEKAQTELREHLQSLRCDPSSVSGVQPCRLPGVLRPETLRWQTLLYLDLSQSYE
jgi:hypothetical protein